MDSGPATLCVDDETTPGEMDAIVGRAIAELAGGGAVVVPTDTVYGLAAHRERPEGLERLFALKGRSRDKSLAVLAADAPQAHELLEMSGLSTASVEAVEVLMSRAWPGALTLVGPRSPRWAGVGLGGDPATIGVRVPASRVVRAIAERVGPIVTTSANRTGEPTPEDAQRAARSLAGEIALVIDAGPGGGEPSTVLDITAVPFRILRRGGCDPTGYGLAPELFEVDAARDGSADG